MPLIKSVAIFTSLHLICPYFSHFSWHVYVSVCACMCVCFRARVCNCIWSSDLCFVTHGSFAWPPTSTELWPPYISTQCTPPSPLCPFLSSFPSLSSSLSFVYLLMCEIILGWRDGFLPEGLSRGVSLLFNNRLGVYVYLSMVIDYRLVFR